MALAASAVLAIAVWIGVATFGQETRDTTPPVTAEQYEWLKNALAENASESAAPSAEPARPVYKYSVIPGGAYDGDELRHALADPVVAAHYAKVDRAEIRTEVVTADRYVHVSYRKGDRIYWTKKKVLLRKGETFLTDGKTQIRSRCGNCIADEPLGPTATDEPDLVEFDRLVDSDSPNVPTPKASGIGRTPSLNGTLAAGQSTPPGDEASGSSVNGTRAPFVGGVGTHGSAGGTGSSDVPLVAAKRSGNRQPGDNTSGNDTSGNGTTEPSSPGAHTPDPGSDIDLPPLAELPNPPGGNGPPKLDDLIPPGPDGPNGPNGSGGSDPTNTFTTSETPQNPPSTNDLNPVPVPEPGTFLLLGGGVAALLRKRSRRSH